MDLPRHSSCFVTGPLDSGGRSLILLSCGICGHVWYRILTPPPGDALAQEIEARCPKCNFPSRYRTPEARAEEEQRKQAELAALLAGATDADPDLPGGVVGESEPRAPGEPPSGEGDGP